MQCPKCKKEMEPSQKYPGCWVCYDCKLRLQPKEKKQEPPIQNDPKKNDAWSSFKDTAQNIVQTAGDAAIEKYNKSKNISTVGLIKIDKEDLKFKIKGLRPKNSGSSMLGKTAKGVLAFSTMGMSLIATKAIDTSETTPWLDFNKLIKYDLIQDDSIVTSGGVGMALVGGLAFGGFGAIAGGITGKRKTKRKIEHLIINVTINDFDCPSLWIPFITSSTKIDSKKYTEALRDAYTTMATLDTIVHNQQ